MSIIDKLGKFNEEKIAPPLVKLSENPYLVAIRDGVAATMPFFVIGSIFLLVVFFPVPSWEDFIDPYMDTILDLYRMTMGIVSIYATIAIAYNLSKQRKVNMLTGSLMSLMVFLFLAAPLVDDNLPARYLAAEGLFTAIISSIFSIEFLRFLTKRKITIRMPKGVPPAVAASFESLIPMFLLLLVVWVIRTILHIDVPGVILKLFSPLVVAVDSIIAPVVLSFVEMALWSAGIHGAAVIETGILNPFLLQNLAANQTALMAGDPMPYIFVPPFADFYMTIGGGGAMLAIPFMLFRAKSKRLRRLGGLSIVPAIFGINEPLLFGMPMVLNPLFLIPMMLAMAVTGVIAYIVTMIGMVSRMSLSLPWSTPAPIGAYLATGGDIRAGILSVILAVIAGLIYLPFLRIYDKKLTADENAAEEDTVQENTVQESDT